MKNKNYKKIIYRSFIFLSFLFLFFVINSNSVFAADFEINVGSTEWEINSNGIYKNSSKIGCCDIQIGNIPNDGFLVKNSSETKLFLIAEDNIYVSAMDSFDSLTYPDSISDSFIIKDSDDDVLLYVDANGLHYKEGMCEDCCECQEDSDCDDQYIGCFANSNKVKERVEDEYGICDGCNCDYEDTDYNPVCAEDQCGSECVLNSDCGSGYYCTWYWAQACFCREYTGPGGGCFKEGTMISTPEGEKEIESLVKGDIVYAFDHKTDEIVETVVKKLLIHEDFKDPAVLLTLNNGQELYVTLNHPFPNIAIELKIPAYKDIFHPYSRLELFSEGDRMMYLNNNDIELVEIESIESIDYFDVEYHLELEYPNNFFVNGLLVHNLDCHAACVDAPNYAQCMALCLREDLEGGKNAPGVD